MVKDDGMDASTHAHAFFGNVCSAPNDGGETIWKSCTATKQLAMKSNEKPKPLLNISFDIRYSRRHWFKINFIVGHSKRIRNQKDAQIFQNTTGKPTPFLLRFWVSKNSMNKQVPLRKNENGPARLGYAQKKNTECFECFCEIRSKLSQTLIAFAHKY